MDADSRKVAGCPTCGIEAFKNKQEQFEHSFSLKHHTRVDENTGSKWYHICELCKLKVGPLNNFAVHVTGRKHRRAVELFKESIERGEAKAGKKKVSTRQKGAKVAPTRSKKQVIPKARQGNAPKRHISPRESVKNSKTVKKKSNVSQHIEDCHLNLKSKSRGSQQEKSPDPEEGAGTEQGAEAQLGENTQPSGDAQARSKKKPSSELAAKRHKFDNEECDGAVGEDNCGEGDDEVMNRNWNGGGYPPRFPMGGPPLFRGRGMPMGFRGGRGNMPFWGRPPFGPYNSPRPFNRYGRRPPDEGPSPWESDGYGYNGDWRDNRQWNFNFDEDIVDTVWHNANDDKGGSTTDNRDGGKNSSHQPSENASQPGTTTASGPSKESSEEAAAQGGQPSSSSKPGSTSSNGSRPSTPSKSSLNKSSTPTVSGAGSGKASLPAKSSLKSVTPAKELAIVRRGEAAKGVVKKPLSSTTTCSKSPAAAGGVTTKTTGPGLQAKNKVAAIPKTSGILSSKVVAQVRTSGERLRTLGPTKAPAAAKAAAAAKAPAAANAKAPVSTCSQVANSTKPSRSSASPSLAMAKAIAQVKKEVADGTECAEEAAAPVAAQTLSSSSNRSHLIFLSSEDDEKDEEGNKPQSKRKSRLDGDTSAETTKKGKAGAAAANPPLCSPEREVPAKKGPLLKSPKLGLMTTKDMYRKDVLEKLINFPSSPQVQAQLNKWMAEMRKYQRSISARNTLRLSSTQARLEQEEDMLGSVPSIDFDVLLRQVESCELPEEMLKSLMQALNTDMEQPPLSTIGEAPSSTTASSSSGSSKAGSILLSGSSAKVDATKRKADTSSPMISEPAKDLVLKRKSPIVAAKSAAATSTAGKDSSSSSSSSSSSDDDECVVLPTPKKHIVSVLIDSDDDESESSTDEEQNEDIAPSTTSKPSGRRVAPVKKPVTSQGSSVSTMEESSSVPISTRKAANEGPAYLKESPKTPTRGATASRERKQSASSTTRDDNQTEVQQARHPRLRSRLSESVCDSADITTSVSSSSLHSEGGLELPAGDSQRPASRTKSSTPTAAVAAGVTTSTSGAPATVTPSILNMLPPTMQAAPLFASAAPQSQAPTRTPAAPQPASNGGPPLASVAAKTEPPSPPPALGTTPPTFNATPPTLSATPPVPPEFKGIIDDLTARCRQEDAIRHELEQVEQSILSTLAALEELKRRKEELMGKVTQARKERLDMLQYLQGAVSAQQGPGQPVVHFTLPAHSVAATEMLSSFGGRGAEMMFNIAQAPPPNATGQAPQMGGVFPQANVPTAQEIAQLLLPHLQQFGDVDINSLAATMTAAAATAPSSSSLPTMSPEVSGGPSSRKPTAKRKTSKDGEPAVTTRKRPKATRSETEGDIDELQMYQIPPCLEISAHDSAIVALKLHGHYVYSCSNDCSARRHDLLDASQCVKYLGSTKTVNSIEVHNGKGQGPVLYAASLDGNLRSYNTETGECTSTFNADAPIVCTAVAWGKIYLGLQTGFVSVFNIKSQKFQDNFYCSDTSVSRITTATEGAQKLLCTVTYDGSITIRDPSTGLLFRCLEGVVQPPSCITVNNGFVYTSSTDRTIRVHELRTGCLFKVYESKSAATGMRFQKGLLVCCSFDGLIRCYRTKDFSCEVVYYGAGKNMVMCLDVGGPLIATGNRKGKVEVIKFDKSNVQACEIRPCNLKFAREEDLVHHLKREHIGLGPKGSMTCPWSQCQMSFSGPNCNKDFEKHLMDHACT